jgi:hypothetical protein
MINRIKYALGGKKLINSLLISLFATLLFAKSSYAATSIRIQTPPSLTNKSDFSLVFVAQTTTGNDIDVQCYKQGPSDVSFIPVGSVIHLTNPGNTGTCSYNLNQGNGTYQFKVTAVAGAESASDTTSTDFNNSTPGIPTNYSKSKDACVYKITFRTADDNGKTIRVELYRSTDINFTADSDHRVNSINIGSNTDGTITDNVAANCNTTYYYAIRAFDAYGNGSGVVGDSNVITTTTTTASNAAGATTAQGAIPISGGQSQEVLGTGTNAAEKGVLGTESTQPTQTPKNRISSQNPIANGVNWVVNHKKASLIVLLIIFVALAYLYRRFKK